MQHCLSSHCRNCRYWHNCTRTYCSNEYTITKTSGAKIDLSATERARQEALEASLAAIRQVPADENMPPRLVLPFLFGRPWGSGRQWTGKNFRKVER